MNALKSYKIYDFSIILLLSLILFSFIPIPKLPLIGISPTNFIFYIIILYLFFQIKNLQELDAKVFGVLLLIVIFILFSNLLGMIRGKEFGNIANYIRMILFMLFIPLACKDEKKLMVVIKFFLLMAAFSVLFGLLIYLFGGPFADIKKFLTQSQATAGKLYYDKGSQLSGLYCVAHVFGYLLACVPVLTIGVYWTEKRKKWIECLFIFSVGLFLNAERSALLMNILVFFLWFAKDKKNRLFMSFVFVMLGVFFLFMPYLINLTGFKKPTESTASHQRGTIMERMQKSSTSDVADRLKWQLNGIISVLKSPILGVDHDLYLRTVHNLPDTIKTLDRYSAPAPHNHYVNVGMWAGVTGWLIMLALFTLLISIHKETKEQLQGHTKTILAYRGLSLAVLGAMGNGLFHNHGIFRAEFATCTLVGLLFAFNRLAKNYTAEENAQL